MKNTILSMIALVATAAAAPAFAEVKPVVLHGEVKLERKVTENGATRIVLVDPKLVVPGDRLLFVTRYENGGTAPVQNFVVTNPLPAAVTLAAGEVAGDQVSVDGGKTWGKIATLTVVSAQGVKRQATVTDVTHIRWTIPTIAAGASGKVDYHAIVR